MKSILKDRTVLIVADSGSQSALLYNYLVGSGLNVMVALTGEDALKIAAELQPHIIMLDVVLAGQLTGFETCRRLKRAKNTAHIPIMFITELDNTIDKMHAFAAGAVDYITKPIQSEEVLARLRAHLVIRQLHDQLQENNAQLRQEILQREELIAELDAFAHSVAHDLKTPINVMTTHAQFLHKNVLKMSTDELKKYTGNIFRNGRKATNIVDELLLLASIRTEQVAPKPLDMRRIVDEMQDRLVYLIDQYQAEMIVPQQWPVAWGHAPWVEEIWLNYCSNAIKYGGRPPKVELGATVNEDDTIKFWVKDNGAGLSPEAQQQLFIPFTRLSQVGIEGHGLGLSIVQRILKKLGGRVGVESDGVPGRGSIFSFYLPLYDSSPMD